MIMSCAYTGIIIADVVVLNGEKMSSIPGTIGSIEQIDAAVSASFTLLLRLATSIWSAATGRRTGMRAMNIWSDPTGESLKRIPGSPRTGG